MASLPTKQKSVPEPVETLEEKFPRLAKEWHQAVAHHSSSRIRDNHPAYKEIIDLGPAVVPLLLQDMETNRRHWLKALAAITGADPLTPEDAGNIVKMAQACCAGAPERLPMIKHREIFFPGP